VFFTFFTSCLLRLDYSGIALLIMGSFVPWLYYSFYCSPQPRLIYLTIVCVLGIAAIIVAQWDRFSTPRHRPTRAGTPFTHPLTWGMINDG
jgi:adiponectin receptor